MEFNLLKSVHAFIKTSVTFFFVTLLFTPSPVAAEVNTDVRVQLGSDYLVKDRIPGIDLGVRYNLNFTERFQVGFLIAYNKYSRLYQQIHYGTLLSHQFPLSDNSGWVLEYGLLADINMQDGKHSAALAHDTRLAAGYAFSDWGILLGYHVASERYYDTQTRSFDRVALSLQYRCWATSKQPTP